MWHIHQNRIPHFIYPLDFSALLNLVTALNTIDQTTIKNFVKMYVKEEIDAAIVELHPELDDQGINLETQTALG